MKTSHLHKSALASAVAVALGMNLVPQVSVADITLTFVDNTSPSAIPLPFAVPGSDTLQFKVGKEFRVMTPLYGSVNNGQKDAMFGGETWTFNNSLELIGTADAAAVPLGGNTGQTGVNGFAGLTAGVAGFPICPTPSTCPVLQQGADFLGAGNFNFLAPILGSIPANTYGVGTVALNLDSPSVIVHLPVAQVQWADGSYVIGGDPNPNPDNGTKCNGPAGAACGGPGVFIISSSAAVTSAPGAADITLDYVLHGERTMTFDEVTVGGFNKQTVQWELPGSATINNQNPVAVADGSAGAPLAAAPGVSRVVDVLANDSDPDHALLGSTAFDTLTVAGVGTCDSGGTLTNNNTDVTYQSAPAASGIETCTYTVADGRTGVSAPATITVQVGGADSPPTGNPDGPGGAFQTLQGQVVSVDVLANDNDLPENDPFTVTRVDATSVELGTVAVINGGVQGGNNVTYTPASGFFGTDSFTYDVTDKDGTTAGVNVQIEVTAFTESSAGTVTISTRLAASDIPVVDPDTSVSCQGGCFRIAVTGVPAGGQVEILLPVLSSAYQDPSVLRHFVDSTMTWKAHELPDGALTAPADSVSQRCPGFASPNWRGPTTGDNCVKYTITDNGPNDDDPAAGSIADPVGFGLLTTAPVQQESLFNQNGCTLTSLSSNATWRNSGHWMLIGASLLFLRLFRKKPGAKNDSC